MLLFNSKPVLSCENRAMPPTCKYRRHRGDVIETYKILHGMILYDTAVSPVLPVCHDSVTRGNTWKL